MRIGSLCTGYGGLDHAVQNVYGGTLVWVSDIDKGACKLLAHRYPDVPNLGDMTAVDWSAVEPVDVICGGTPCQDISHAGKRAGMSEGTRSNLWVAMRDSIAAIRPRLVVWENVGGAYSASADSEMEPCPGCVGDGRRVHLRALGRVLGDLASLGYDARWHGLRAADVGAPHGRFRVFVVAADARDRAGHRERPRSESWQGGTSAAEPAHIGHERTGSARGRGAGPATGDLLPTPRATDGTKGGPGQRGSSGDLMLPSAVALLPTPRVENNENRQSEGYGGKDGNFHGLLTGQSAWGDYATAIARWEHVFGRPAPAPTQTSSKGNPQLSARFTEWLMGLPDGWITDVPGITRNEALRLCGNGVVPQQAIAALREMASWESVAS